MASKQAKVRCPHCSVEFGFALPQKYVDRPTKKLKFICEYCTERFAVQVSDLFSEDGTELAASKIRHQSIYGLLLYSSWEEVIQSHFGEPIEESDPISAFGKEWKPASMFAELSTIFPNADIRAAISEDEEEPVLESEEDVAVEVEEDVVVEAEEEDVVVEVEEEPSYEDDLFMDKPLEESAWTDKVEDPFDIPISNITDSIDIPEEANVNDQEDEDVVDLIADGAMDIFLDESEEAPPVMVEEDSEDPFLAISDEIEIQQEHSIDALISTLDSELEETKLSGTNTLDLLQSEEEFPSAEAQKDFVSTVKSELAEADQPKSNTLDLPLSEEEQPEPNQESLYSEASHEEIEEESEEPLASTVNKEESFESMSTVIDTDPFKSLGLDSEETLQSAPPVEDEDVVLVEATVVSEEDSHESVHRPLSQPHRRG